MDINSSIPALNPRIHDFLTKRVAIKAIDASKLLVEPYSSEYARVLIRADDLKATGSHEYIDPDLDYCGFPVTSMSVIFKPFRDDANVIEKLSRFSHNEWNGVIKEMIYNGIFSRYCRINPSSKEYEPRPTDYNHSKEFRDYIRDHTRKVVDRNHGTGTTFDVIFTLDHNPLIFNCRKIVESLKYSKFVSPNGVLNCLTGGTYSRAVTVFDQGILDSLLEGRLELGGEDWARDMDYYYSPKENMVVFYLYYL